MITETYSELCTRALQTPLHVSWAGQDHIVGNNFNKTREWRRLPNISISSQKYRVH